MNTYRLRLLLGGWMMCGVACVATGSKIDGNGTGGAYGGEGGATHGPTSSTGTKGSTSATSSTHAATTSTSVTTATTSGPTTTSSVGSTTAATTSAVSSTSTGAACQQGTRITYGTLWKHAPNHPAQYDDVPGMTVTWDGSCPSMMSDSYATLSNGWTPYFLGTGGCVIGLDADCPSSPPAPCKTRITYGPSWQHPANHPEQYDDVDGHIIWTNSRACVNVGLSSYATLSNGWQPTFQGTDACDMSFRYENCGGV